MFWFSEFTSKDTVLTLQSLYISNWISTYVLNRVGCPGFVQLGGLVPSKRYSKFYPKRVIQIDRVEFYTEISKVKRFIQKSYPKTFYRKDTENLYNAFVYSLVILLFGIYPFNGMLSLLVTIICYSCI